MNDLIMKLKIQLVNFGHHKGTLITLKIYEDKIQVKYLFKEVDHYINELEMLEVKRFMFFKIVHLKSRNNKRVRFRVSLFSQGKKKAFFEFIKKTQEKLV